MSRLNKGLEGSRTMKDVELRLMAELLKNSCRSDRELAKAIGVSQPTVSRIRTKLEKKGIIREYTIIPDFSKLGYNILAITFAKFRPALSAEETEKAREMAKNKVEIEQGQFGIVMLERGIGLGYDGIMISLYRNYSDYTRHQEAMKTFPFVDNSKMETFLVNLEDKIRYHPLSFHAIAKQLATSKKGRNEYELGIKPESPE